MSNPIQTIPLDALREWMLKQAQSERQNGEIAFANHTMNLRDRLTAAAKKQSNQLLARANTAQDAMENAA